MPDTICVMKSDSMPWFCNKAVYWILSLVGLSWPLRLYIERKIAYVNFTIHKQVSQYNGSYQFNRIRLKLCSFIRQVWAEACFSQFVKLLKS